MVMKKKEKILILSGSFGQGHQQVATAIKEAAELRLPNFESIVVDFMAWAHPNVYPISHYVYMKSIQKLPQLYGYLYKKTHDRNAFSLGLNNIMSAGMGKMLKLLQQIRPTVVVSTFPFAAGILSKLKEYGLTNVPLVTVITDHSTHSYWIHPFTDHYIVGSNGVRQELIQLGITGEQITCTGIPIRTKFLQPMKKEAWVRKHGLNPDLPTILIMGGGDGLIGEELLNADTLDTLPFKAQFIILCGRNEKLRKQLEEGLHSSKHHILLFGYIEHVQELMAISDLIVTKPGGVTTSEAIAMELPMILYKPLPGQEQENALFLTKAGVAVKAKSGSEIIASISTVLKNPAVVLSMRDNARNINRKEAAFDAVDIITEYMMNQRPFYEAELSPMTKWRTNRLLKREGAFYSHI
ncbi:1,2-diacylglycerol 3-glucosyltransferase [Heyndrickxia shackletonii]|uniref:1,2-diacylglycerol 3-glucosyltransferase n=1 Tax=Heyndrickxia shackletonii TaxID=157838 RepID=A0A0Q3WU64_9BACI|nr:glycosyltransferase [Heyndrickxia shackletonii]KQL53058.1 1,2-diacylglycerol 3-glucosyltransferase [Heyndrickxia shackletonii]NEY98615.1 glycosyltransferase [Heyndrickxia shackletonii]